ncbi:MAG TPA: glycine cleavage T C-terminal barrel domain-containing protein, partial [Armatimonadota bacterium]
GASKKLVGLEAIDRCIPRHGYAVAVDGQSSGVITSGTFSPTLEKGIAMAYVPSQYGQIGDLVNIDIRGKSCAAKVVAMPFYQP